MGLFWASARFQLIRMRTTFNESMVLIIQPLLAIALLSVLVDSGRRDLAPFAVVGTGVMSLWTMALWVSGSIIDMERWGGTLEAMVTTPASFATVMLGRIVTVTVVSLLGLLEGIVVAWAMFGIGLHVYHVPTFVLTLLCTAFAVAGTGLALSGLFVFLRAAQTFQNSLTYPFYVLSGAVVPITFLPGWLQPLSKAVFLSWSSSLLRDSLRPAPLTDVGFRLGVILVCGVVALCVGLWSIEVVLRRMRHNGTVGQD